MCVAGALEQVSVDLVKDRRCRRRRTLGPSLRPGQACARGVCADAEDAIVECSVAQGRYAEAEPLYKRALAIHEKALGSNPQVAATLENYAVVLRRTGRGEWATMIELRAKAIRAKHAQDNPVE